MLHVNLAPAAFAPRQKCVPVWAVFQQGDVELHGDVVSRGHLVPGAVKETLAELHATQHANTST